MYNITEKNKNKGKTNLIESIDYFSCGYCTNNLKNIFRGVKKKKLIFEAGVFLIKHKKYGYILYDTGYSRKLLENKLKYFIYRFLNPININKEAMINYQLEKKGIELSKISYIILSHLHPDHIGGIEFFPEAKIILSEKSYREYKRNSYKSLIFKELLPKDFENRLIIFDPNIKNKKFKYLKTYDLFSDNSILLSEMNGHSLGQCCAYIEEKNLFLAADSTWRTDFIDEIEKMRFLPRLIQNNFKEYKKDIELLKKMREDGLKIVVSHEQSSKVWRVLKNR